MRNFTLVLSFVAAVVLWLVPAHAQSTQVEAEYVMNFGTVAPDNTPWADQLRELKQRIESDSGGRVKIKLFLGGSLGSEIEMIQDVARGERLQGGGFSTGAIGEAMDVPILTMVELPYLFSSNEQADAVLDQVLFEPTQKALDSKGFVLGAWTENGWRNFATKGPASTMKELKKFKMRSQESPVHLDMYKQFGVQAVAKPVSEVLPALNTGIVDGFDNTPLFSLAAGWIEPATHYTLSRHIYQPAAVVYSKKFMDSLPEDLRVIVLGDPSAEAAKGRGAVRALEQELLQTIREMGKKVIDLTPEQRKAFKIASIPVHKAFLASHQDLVPVYAKVKAKLRTVR